MTNHILLFICWRFAWVTRTNKAASDAKAHIVVDTNKKKAWKYIQQKLDSLVVFLFHGIAVLADIRRSLTSN